MPQSYRCGTCLDLVAEPPASATTTLVEPDSQPPNDPKLLEEIRELKSIIEVVESKINNVNIGSKPARETAWIDRLEKKLSKEIADTHSAVKTAQQETKANLETIARKVENSGTKTLKQIQDACKAITDGIQDNVLSKMEDDFAPSLQFITDKLKQLRTDLATIHAWTQDALQGPKERRFSTLSSMVEYWTKGLGHKFGKDIKAIAKSPPTADKKQKSETKAVEEFPETRPVHLDIAGMQQLLGMLEQQRGLEIIRDLPELFNSVDDRLREKRRTQLDEPENGCVAETIETLVRVQLRMRAWQAQNDLIRLPRDKNETLDYRYHFPVGSESTTDQEFDRRIKDVKTTGYVFLDGDNEVVLQKAEVIVWEFAESPE
jgi:hypothetical protein